MAYFIPKNEAERVIWFADHAIGVATHGATVGLIPAEITQAQVDADVVALLVGLRSTMEAKKQEMTAFKNLVLYNPVDTPMPAMPAPIAIVALPVGALAGIMERAQLRAARIKAHPAYTIAIGEACRIISTAAPDPAEQPVVTAKVLTDYQVELKFSLAGHEMIEIWEMRGDATTWSMLDTDTKPPYIDKRPPLVPGQPEKRSFRIRFRDDDEPYGIWSEVVTVWANE